MYSQDNRKYQNINNKFNKNILVEIQYLTANQEKIINSLLQEIDRHNFNKRTLKENIQIKDKIIHNKILNKSKTNFINLYSKQCLILVKSLMINHKINNKIQIIRMKSKIQII